MSYLRCLGASHEVGRSAFLLSTDNNFLLDFGIKIFDESRKPKYPLNFPEELRAALITHAHLDHSGFVPYLYTFTNVKWYATPPTRDICEIMFKDSMKIMGEELPYSETHFRKAMRNWHPTFYGKELYFGKTKVVYEDAGHILGSSMLDISYNNKRIFYTGDFKVTETRMHKGAEEVKDVDVLIVEGTYGLRDHPPRKEIEEKLISEIEETLEEEGHALLPAFALGRSQELIGALGAHNIDAPIFLDGMSKAITEIYEKYPYYLNNFDDFSESVDSINFVNSSRVRKQATKQPSIIITTAGMMEGGPVLNYLNHVNEKSKVIFTGYNVEGTNGWRLLNHGKILRDGYELDVSLPVEYLDFSVTPDTKILVRQNNKLSLIPIKDVDILKKPKVWAFDHNTLKADWYPVKKLIKHRYRGSIYEIFTKSGRHVKATKGHSFFILKNGRVIEMPGDRIKKDDNLAIVKSFNSEVNKFLDLKHFFKTKGPKFPLKKLKLSDELARLFGYYVAEGNSTNKVNISVGHKEFDILEDLKKCVSVVFPFYSPHMSSPHPTEIQFKFGGTFTANVFSTFAGRTSKYKRVPSFLFSSSESNILHFLGALFSGDGWWDKEKIRIKSVSYQLIDDLLYLFSLVGITAKYEGIRVSKERLSPTGHKFKKSISYALRIQGYYDLLKFVPFLSNRIRHKAEKWLKDIRFPTFHPPLTLPVNELGDVNLSKLGSDTRHYIKRCLKGDRYNIGIDKLAKEEHNLPKNISSLVNSDLLFDPVIKIKKSNYIGEVYDLSVPGPQNFLGGFGGIFLHNSAHVGRTSLLKFIKKANPEKIVVVHADSEVANKFTQELNNDLGYDAVAPNSGDIIELS